MKNKIIKVFPVLFFLVSLLSGCSFFTDVMDDYVSEDSLVRVLTGDDPKRSYGPADHSTFGVSLNPTNEASLISQYAPEDINKVHRQGIGAAEDYLDRYYPCPSASGVQKNLVVPILFKNTIINEGRHNEEYYRKKLTEYFFGDGKNLPFESVASYYSKASFNSLQITGEVSQFVMCHYSVEDITLAETQEAGYQIVSNIIEEVYNILFKNTNYYEYSEFDGDNDNVIDNIYLVYFTNRDPNPKTALWAFNTSLAAWPENYNDCQKRISKFVWAPYSMIGDEQSPFLEVFLHETGHVYGLDDYYNAYQQDLNSPTGGIDMMDNNVGGQNSFSTYYLGWTCPKLITNETFINHGSDSLTLELLPFSESGQSCIVANTFNGTPFDEYLMLEYYTPTGLNRYHSTLDPEHYYSEPTNSGLLIYHVDQRLFGAKQSTVDSDKYEYYFLDGLPEDDKELVWISSSNANSILGNEGYSKTGYNLISLLGANAINGRSPYEYGNYIADNSALFKPEVSFSDVYPNFAFNKGGDLDFEIKVIETNAEHALVTFTKK